MCMHMHLKILSHADAYVCAQIFTVKMCLSPPLLWAKVLNFVKIWALVRIYSTFCNRVWFRTKPKLMWGIFLGDNKGVGCNHLPPWNQLFKWNLQFSLQGLRYIYEMLESKKWAFNLVPWKIFKDSGFCQKSLKISNLNG